MKNKLPDLNDHLFMQLERLSDENLTPAEIKSEAERGLAMVKVSDQIIKGADLQLKAAQVLAKGGLEGGLIRDKFKMIDPPRDFKTVDAISDKPRLTSGQSPSPSDDEKPSEPGPKKPYAWRETA